MDDLFNAHFTVGERRYIYRLDPMQADVVYRRLSHFISTGEGAGGLDLTFRETGRNGEMITNTFCLDSAEAFTLFRRLGTHLQKHYPGSGPSTIQIHEATS